MLKRTWLHLALAGCLGIFPILRLCATVQLSPDSKILHALNRLTFGPRPGDVERVRAVGLRAWIDLQLHPERLPENPRLAEKLAPLDTLRMTPVQLVENYPPPQLVRAMVEGRVPYPEDPEKRVMVQRIAARLDRKQGKETEAAAKPDQASLLDPAELRVLREGSAEEKVKWFRALSPEKRSQVLDAMPARLRRQLYEVCPVDLRRKMEAERGPRQIIAADLAEGKLDRAIYSERQLEEVLVDFWYNHFNVFLDKGADRYLTTAYERDAIRPHILGRFSDLLLATAQSPAMLFYLDNWQSVDPNQEVKLFLAGRKTSKRAAHGLNENYARELLELHTLGVDGGYTQKDVTEIARCFTGWTIRNPQRGGEFVFNRRLHDEGAKVVLGRPIAEGGGITDGLRVLDLLAHHPATARHISYELAQRFVADAPPQALVDRMARTFRAKDGDLREVMRTMLNSPEFWSEDVYRAKTKSPLEFVVSAIRAIHADVDYGFPLAAQLGQLGQPLYRKQEPTGYSNASQDWLNSAGLVSRINFGLALMANKVPGIQVDPAQAGWDGAKLGSPEFQKK